MDKDDDPWEILGVSKDATEAEIKKAFRKGALKYHPDKQTTEEDKAAASDIFAKFSDAYDTLTDPVKRYDWKLAHEKKTQRVSSTSSSSGKGAPKTYVAPSSSSRQTPPPPGPKRHSTGTPTQKRPDPNNKNKRPSAPPPSTRRSGSATPPVGGARKQVPKRTSTPVASPKTQAAKRTSAPPPQSSMGWRRQTSDGSTKSGQGKPSPRPAPKHRDPFDIFESVMKEEYGEDYKNKEESGWKGSIGVPGLAKINPFRKKKGESSTKGKLGQSSLCVGLEVMCS